MPEQPVEGQDEEEAYEEEYDDEESEDEVREPITHCIHRLPFKG